MAWPRVLETALETSLHLPTLEIFIDMFEEFQTLVTFDLTVTWLPAYRGHSALMFDQQSSRTERPEGMRPGLEGK